MHKTIKVRIDNFGTQYISTDRVQYSIGGKFSVVDLYIDKNKNILPKDFPDLLRIVFDNNYSWEDLMFGKGQTEDSDEDSIQSSIIDHIAGSSFIDLAAYNKSIVSINKYYKPNFYITKEGYDYLEDRAMPPQEEHLWRNGDVLEEEQHADTEEDIEAVTLGDTEDRAMEEVSREGEVEFTEFSSKVTVDNK